MSSPSGSADPQPASPKSDKDPAAAVKKIGKYDIQKKVGAGGMGTVYLAVDSILKRSCALKVLPQEKAKNPTLVKRFRSEAQQAANLRHENIVAIYEAGEADGFLYIAMEYVEGTDVAKLVQKRGVIPLRRSIEIVKQVSQALQHAHEQGIVHRDIKPGNLLVRLDGVVKLADLGLARSLDDVDTAITRAGTTVGTVDYMSPEQARDSKAADVRSDIYSLGCTWYFMLTGQPPFADGSLTQKLRSHAESPIPDPRPLNPSVPEAVLGVIRRMTEKKPTLRYQTPQELLEDLDATSLTSDGVSDKILEDAPELEEPAERSVESGRPKSRGDKSRGDKSRVESPGAEDLAEMDDPHARRGKKSKSVRREPEESDPAIAESTPSPQKAKPAKRSAGDDDVPAFKPPPGRDPKDKEALLQPDKPKRSNAALFYALLGLAVVGVVSLVLWGVSEYSNSSSVSDRTANPFANRDAVAQAAGAAGNSGGPGSVGGTGSNVGGTNLNGPGQPPVTNLTDPNANANGNLGGPGSTAIPPPSGLSPGPMTTQIGGDPSNPGSNSVGGSDSGTGNQGGTGNSSTGGPSPSGNTGGNSGGNVGGNSGGTPSGTSPGGKTIAGPGSTAVGSPTSSGGKSTNIGGGATAGGPVAGTTGPGKTGSSANNQGAAAKAAAAQADARNARELQALPVWATQPRTVDGLPVLTVQPGSSGLNQFSTLNAALDNVPAGGACLKLVGSGPFPLYPVKIEAKTRVVIESQVTASSAQQPIIILLPSESGSVSDFIEAKNTTLELRRLHLVFDATGFKTKADDSLLSVVASDLFLQNCSISVKGMPETPMTAVKIAGKVSRSDPKAQAQPRVFFDHILIRGNNLSALTANGEHLDLASRGSLLWSGQAPAVRFGTVARNDAESSRTVRLVSTTLCSLQSAFRIGGDGAQPVPTAIELLNTLVASPFGGEASNLLAFDGWTLNQHKAALGKFLSWKSTGTLYTGWTSLMQLNPGDISAAKNFGNWQAAWKDKAAGETEQFQTLRWPLRSIPDISHANLESLSPQTLGRQYVKTEEGGWPGCSPEHLVTVNLDALAAAQVASARPAIPPGMFNMPVKDVITVDVTKQDLGKVLEGKKLQTGMTIKVIGSGTRQSSPIVIENVWVRILFEQTDGAPLVIQPKAVESKLDGFLTIRNGGVEIDRGVLTLPVTERGAAPKWLIHVVDGDLGLYRCRLQGSLNGSARTKSLIRWESKTGQAPVRPFQADYDGYQVIQSSYLAGSGTLIDADIRGRAMIFHNSVLVSRDDLIVLNIEGPDTEIDAAVDIRYSTLSAADRFWQVRGGDLSVPASTPLTIYADRTVFAPPLRAGTQKIKPSFLTYSGSVFDRSQLVWWEDHCGYAAEITNFVRADAEANRETIQSFEEKWLKVWGDSRVLEALRGTNGVVLKKDLPTKPEDRNKLEPDDFELLPACRAAKWEGGKLPIGAYIATMQLPPLRVTAAPPDKKKAAPNKTGPSPQAPATGF